MRSSQAPPPSPSIQNSYFIVRQGAILTGLYLLLVCCIYHKAREVGESSSEEDSDSSSSSDSDEASDGGGADDGRARMGGKGKRKDNGHQHGDGEEGCGGGHGGKGSSWKGKERARRTARNAYEKAPKNQGVSDAKK